MNVNHRATENQESKWQLHMRKSLPLSSLHAFESAARLGSFKIAASSLHRTPSAISHQIRDLETRLGMKLFERHPRHLELTAKGRHLAPILSQAFSLIENALERLEHTEQREVRLSFASGFLSRYVLGHLDDLTARIAGYRILIESTSSLADVGNGGTDLAVRFGPKPDESLDVKQLIRDHSVMVADPNYFSKSKRYSKARLQKATLLGLSQFPNLWDEAFEQLNLKHLGDRILFDSFSAALDATRSGIGITLSPFSICEPLIKSRGLALVSDTKFDNGWGYWLVTKRGSQKRAVIRKISDWLVQRVLEN
jgi:LysR family transcriptional regulator, glycine cleavage system transcriptional activator